MRIGASAGARFRAGLSTGMTAGHTGWWCVCAASGAVGTLGADGSVVPAVTLGSIGTLGAGGARTLVGTIRGVGVACGRASEKILESFVRAACCLSPMRVKGADSAGWRRALVRLTVAHIKFSAKDSLGILTWLSKKLTVLLSRFLQVLVM